MFKSTRRPIVFPQSEHLKLAGTLAFLWGNTQFEFPPLPRLSVIAGNALHDRAYGYLDNLPIGEIDDEQWVSLTRHGFFMSSADPVADVITRYHLLRLVSGRDTPARQALAEEMRVALAEEMSRHALDANLFKAIDRMTNLCDRISFDFCREKPTEGQFELSSRYSPTESRVIYYRVAGSNISLDPWPLQPEAYDSYLVAYQLEGYPERLDALIVPYYLRPMRS
jgi:hypothetical protein